MTFALPPGYVDPHPSRGPWISAETPPTDKDPDYSVLFEDGHSEPATWTGKLWWRDREMHPIAWRRIGTVHKAP